MQQELRRTIETRAFWGSDCLAEVLGVPIDYSGSQQVETCHAIVLTLGGVIPDFTLTSNAQGAFQGVMGLALIQTNIDAVLNINVKQPVDVKSRAPSSRVSEVA